MKNLKKITALFVAAMALCLFASCSNGSDSGSSVPAVTTDRTNPTAPTPETTSTPTPVIYTITFNANDGSENPSTVPQNFTGGVPQKLTPVEELGFTKAGFFFAGWGTALKSKQAKYADEDSYTAVANETLYALWSEIPVYNVKTTSNEHGTFGASPVIGTAGTEITLSNTPADGWRFESYIVTDTDGGAVTVTDGKFTMPAKDVTVAVVFTAIITYTITFNANDGSPTPATATQTFTAGVPQNLRKIAELGFSKNGFKFLGWGKSADATRSYLDGTSYKATADATLFAVWSRIPVYLVSSVVNANGSVKASPSRGIEGTEITLTNTPKVGYQFVSYTVYGSDGIYVEVTNGKFIMPAKNVFADATYSPINYTIDVDADENGNVVTASAETATVGTSVTLTITPASGYQLSTLDVTDENGTSVSLSGTGNSRTFTMPAKNVTVKAAFSALPYAASGDYTKVVTTTINGMEYDLVTFGLWSQTVKSDSVTVNEIEREKHDELIYCKGSDGQWYAKIKENACYSDYKYSDGADVVQSSASTSDYRDSREFLKTAFTAAEIATIADTTVINNARSTSPDANATKRNSGSNQYSGNTPPTDKVFLLSEQEVMTRICGFDEDCHANIHDGTYNERSRIRFPRGCAMTSGLFHTRTEG